MRNQDEKEAEFILENEQKINKTFSWLMLPGVVIGIGLIIFRALNILPHISYTVTATYAVLQLGFWLVARAFIKANPKRRSIKYLYLIAIELSLFMTSISPGVAMFIGFITVPIISCLYFNRRFSLIMTTFSYFMMIASLLIRGYVIPSRSVVAIHENVMAYCVGCSFEYIACSIFVLIVTGLIRKNLDAQFKQMQKIQKIQERLILSIADLVESKDAFTGQHVQRTAKYVERICAKMIEKGYYPNELNEKVAEVMVKAAPLHDMGKMKIPETILEKPGKLTEDEFKIIKMHPLWGEQIIEKAFVGIENDDFTQCALMMALTHHEKWDGSGYPLRLAEKEIPLCGRIMAAADVLDAILTVRPYKPAFTIDEAMNIFADNSGKHFDPLVAEAVLEMETEIAYLQIEAINESTIYEAKREDSGLYKKSESNS